jgi:hypothetical protein
MLCSYCNQRLAEEESMTDHLTHHYYDKQYGVNALGLSELILHILDRLDVLEKARLKESKPAEAQKKTKLTPEVRV